MPLPQVFSYTAQAVVAADCDRVMVFKNPDGSLRASGYFSIKDGSANVVDQKITSVNLTGPQTTTLLSFVTSVLVPSMNAQ